MAANPVGMYDGEAAMLRRRKHLNQLLEIIGAPYTWDKKPKANEYSVSRPRFHDGKFQVQPDGSKIFPYKFIRDAAVPDKPAYPALLADTKKFLFFHYTVIPNIKRIIANRVHEEIPTSEYLEMTSDLDWDTMRNDLMRPRTEFDDLIEKWASELLVTMPGKLERPEEYMTEELPAIVDPMRHLGKSYEVWKNGQA